MTDFSLATRDAWGLVIQVDDLVRFVVDMEQERFLERPFGLTYRVISVNETPDFGRVISTEHGPEQLIHGRIRVRDVAGIGGEKLVLGESVVVRNSEAAR